MPSLPSLHQNKPFRWPYLCLFLIAALPWGKLIAGDLEIRHLTPPDLREANLSRKIVAYRPMRHDGPRMELVRTGNKIIIHNYGHGGGGWTLAPGAAKYVNDLLMDCHDLHYTFHKPITIIGGGVMGLFTAYDLIKRGYSNIQIIAEDFTSTTSHQAGGRVAPVSMDNNPETANLVEKIAIDSARFYDQIARGQNKEFAGTARRIPGYFLNREQSGQEIYVGVIMSPAKEVLVDFDNGTRRPMVVYDDSIFVESGRMLTLLNAYLKANNVKFIQHKITSLDEINTDIIINCTGFGSYNLVQDRKLVNVQGHLITLKQQPAGKMEYMVSLPTDRAINHRQQTINRSVYLQPKINNSTGEYGVLGGTFIAIDDTNDHSANLNEFNLLLNRARYFFGQ